MTTVLRLAFLALILINVSLSAKEPLQLTLPPRWHGCVGVPLSLYFDNVVLTQKPESYQFEVRCSIGTVEDRRWTVTPADNQVGDHELEVIARDASGAVLERARTTLHIAPRTAGEGRKLRILIVGDSLTHASLYPNELARLLAEPGNPAVTFLGTHRPAGAKPGVAHEGYGGWKWADFLNRFAPEPPGVTAGPKARKSTSPFIFAGKDGKGEFDLPRYLREHAGGEAPDVVTFLLGINDCFGAPPDSPSQHIDNVLDQADKLLAEFRKALPKTILAVGLTTPPNVREGAFEANYKGRYSRWGWKRIQHQLVRRMIERLDGRADEGIHLVATELNLDPVDGYPENNGVHPNAVGYAQIGGGFYGWLKNWLASQR